MDVLSELFQVMELDPKLYFRECFYGNWGMAIPEGPFFPFHLLVRGRATLELPRTREQLQLNSGDLVLFFHRRAHRVSARGGGPFPPGEEVVRRVQSGENPFPAGAAKDDEANEAVLVCGHFAMNHQMGRLLMDSLPPVLRVSIHDTAELAGLEALGRLLIDEMSGHADGKDLIVKRLAEVMLIKALRTHTQLAAQGPGLLHALADPGLAAAIGQMHEAPGEDWSVEQLAREAAMSRTRFAVRFREQMGQPPMAYLTEWRLVKARHLLTTSSTSPEAVAASMGYHNSAAFNRAFKNRFGETPRQVRAANRQPPA